MIESSNPYDSNIYLVKGDRTALIDTGTGFDSEHVISLIRDALAGAPLDMVILTHCHYDHVGGLPAIAEEFGCPAYSGDIDAQAVSVPDHGAVLDRMFGGDFKGFPVGPLHDGDVIDLGDHRLRVICTPGHTRGGICLYDEVTRDLFSGDTLFVNGVGRTDFEGGSILDLRESLRRISNIDIRGLYPGHGNVSAGRGPDHVTTGLRLVGE